MNTYKRDEKLSNDTIFTQKHDYTQYVQIHTQVEVYSKDYNKMSR